MWEVVVTRPGFHLVIPLWRFWKSNFWTADPRWRFELSVDSKGASGVSVMVVLVR